MTGPNWKLEDDYKAVTVTFPTNPPVALQLDAAGVDSLLHGLGELRAAMQPPYEPDFAQGQKVLAAQNPRFVTEPDAMLGNSVLHLRDPRFGWLHYMIPREEARKLAGWLQAQVDDRSRLQAPDKKN